MKKFIVLLTICSMLTFFIPAKQAEAHSGFGWFLPGLIIGGALSWGLSPHYYYPPRYYYPPPAYYYPPPAYDYPASGLWFTSTVTGDPSARKRPGTAAWSPALHLPSPGSDPGETGDGSQRLPQLGLRPD